MGYYVHLSVTYSGDCDGDALERLKPLVEKHKKYIEKEWDDVSQDGKHTYEWSREAYWFLEAVLDKKNYNCGPKGMLFTWGIVGNYTSAENFKDCLSPFFEEMLKEEISVSDFDHILVFWEQEQSEQAKAFEIFLNEDSKKLEVKKHELPFCWNQY